jgi:hypothetical protein
MVFALNGRFDYFLGEGCFEWCCPFFGVEKDEKYN